MRTFFGCYADFNYYFLLSDQFYMKKKNKLHVTFYHTFLVQQAAWLYN